MTPAEFAQEYKNLSVYMIDPSAPIDTATSGKPQGQWLDNVNVSSYRLGLAGSGLVGSVKPDGTAEYKQYYKNDLLKAIAPYADGRDNKTGKKGADEGVTVVIRTLDGTEYSKRHTYNELGWAIAQPFY